MSGRRRTALVLLAAAATAVEAAALVMVAWTDTGRALAGAAGLHVAASLLSRAAARRRREDLSVVETDLVLVTALAVPLFGPVLAWWLPRPATKEAEENAHVVFEKYSAHVKPDVPDHERTLFTGQYERDLARELDVESYHEVLHHGTTDQKRNALRRLADLGETKHFRLIRVCLLDPEHEVRLYAYSELERASRTYEEDIAKRSRELQKRPEAPEALLALAQTYFEYAASGIHDEQMAAWYFRSAERYARLARRHGGDDPAPVWIQARALGRLNDFEKARAVLNELSQEQQNLPESCIARAEMAYRRRDYLAARAEAMRLRESDAEMPEWLRALERRS